MRRLATVRVRVTIGAVVVVAIALVAGGAWLVRAQRNSLTNDIETTARLRAHDVAATVADGGPATSLAVPRGDENLVQVVDPKGDIVAASNNIGERRPDQLPRSRGPTDTGPGRSTTCPRAIRPSGWWPDRCTTTAGTYTVYVAASLGAGAAQQRQPRSASS